MTPSLLVVCIPLMTPSLLVVCVPYHLDHICVSWQVDLVVLGAYPGSGSKSTLLTSFLMGCWDADEAEWHAVCKVANGFSNARLSELKALLTDSAQPLMERLAGDAPLPPWMPPLAAKGTMRPTHVLRAPPQDTPDRSLVFEVKGTEFTSGSKVAPSPPPTTPTAPPNGSTISIRSH